MEILCVRPILKIYARCLQAGDAGNYRRYVVTQKLPLLTINIFLPRTGFRTGGAGIDSADAVRMSVWKVFQKESVDDGKYRRVRANGKRQGEEHRKRVPRTSPELPHGKLKKMMQTFHPVTPSPLGHGRAADHTEVRNC